MQARSHNLLGLLAVLALCAGALVVALRSQLAEGAPEEAAFDPVHAVDEPARGAQQLQAPLEHLSAGESGRAGVESRPDRSPGALRASAAVLARGRVLDDLDRPVAGAVVVWRPSAEWFARRWDSSRATLERLSSIGQDPAADAVLVGGPEGVAVARTAADGSFELASAAQARPGLLRAEMADHITSELLRVRPGETDVEVRLVRSSSIRGRLVVPPMLDTSHLRLVLQCAAPLETVPIQRSRGAAEFEALDLRPGRWQLDIEVGDENKLWSHPPIDLAAGQNLMLPTIDLASLLTAMRVEVVDETGALIESAKLELARDRGATLAMSRPAPGVFEFYSADPVVQLVVEAAGYEPQSPRLTAADRRIVLRRGIPLRIVAVGHVPASACDVTLGVQLECAGAAEGPAQFVSSSFGPGRELLLHLPKEGRWSIAWTVCAERDGRAYTRVIEDPRCRGIDVARGGPLQELELRVPQDLLTTGAEFACQRVGGPKPR